MPKTDKIIVPIDLQADASGLSKELQKIDRFLSNTKDVKGKQVDVFNIDKTRKDAKELEKIVKSATDAYGKIDTSKMSEGIGKAKLDINGLNSNLVKLGYEGSSAVDKTSRSFDNMYKPIKKADTAIDKLGRTFMNSLRYNVANDFADAILQSGEKVIEFLEKTDKALTGIRIVSGKSKEEMDAFLTTSIVNARELGNVTQSYLEASEIYYQQGLSGGEVATRTQATIKSANVAGQDVATTADQITAILNGFNIEASQTVLILDKIAQVGAGTATDFQEIAKAAQKVASSSSALGVGVDETLGMISTISSITREAPEAIGTSLNAIFSRFSNLNVDTTGEMNEFTSKIERTMQDANSALTIFGEDGLLKDPVRILSEIAGAWDDLDQNQRSAIATAVGGTRQLNRLMALMENWDMYESYRDMSAEAEGALDEQNDIYMESLQAVKNQAQASKEAMFNELFNADMLKDFYSVLVDVFDVLTGITKSIGGMRGTITTITGLLSGPAMRTFGPNIRNMALGFGETKDNIVGKFTNQTSEADKRLDFAEESGLGVSRKDVMSRNLREIALTKEQNNEYEKQRAVLDEIIIREQKRNQIKNKVIATTGLKDGGASDVTIEKGRNAIEDTKKLLTQGQKEIENIYAKQRADNAKAIGENEKAIEDAVNALSKYETRLAKLNEKIKVKGSKDSDLKEKNILESEIGKAKANKAAAEAKKKAFTPQEAPDIIDIMFGDTKLKEGSKINGKSQQQIEEVKRTINTLVQNNADLAGELANIQLGKGADLKKIITNKKDYREAVENGLLTPERSKQLIDIISKNFSEEFDNELAELTALEKVESGDKSKAKEIGGFLKNIKKGTTSVNVFQGLVSSAQAAAGAFSAFKTVTDSSLNGQEKAIGLVNALGSSLAGIPGPIGMIGSAISIIGPVFIEAFSIGISESEKLQRKLEGLTEGFNATTKTVKQQRSDLSNVRQLYEQLQKTYEETGITYKEMSESQRGQYDQVAEYVEKYAPELVKGYTIEGRAVLDLSTGYEDLKKTKKSYLDMRLEDEERSSYGSMSGDVVSSSSVALSGYADARIEIEKTKKSIAELQKQAAGGTDVSKKMSALEEKLAKSETLIQEVGKSWDSFFTSVVTKGSASFGDIDNSLKNSLAQSLSLSSYLATDTDVSIAEFKNRAETMIESLSGLSLEKQQTFGSFSDSIKEAMFQISTSAKLTKEDMDEFFNSFDTEKEFLSGTYLSEMQEAATRNAQTNSSSEYQKNSQMIGITDNTVGMDAFDSSSLDAQNIKLREQILMLQEKRAVIEATKEDEVKKAYSDNIVYGEGASGTGEESKALETIAELDEIDARIASTQNQIENASSAAGRVTTELAEMYRNLATSSAESFNSIADSYMDMFNAMENGGDFESLFGDFGYSSAEEMENVMGAMYASLSGNSTDFYNEWVDLNSGAIEANTNNLGVFADNYETYNEYMDAVNAAVAEQKVLYEVMSTEGVAAANEQLLRYKIKNYTTELAKAGDKTNLMNFLALDEARQGEIAKKAETKAKLVALKTELQAKKDEGQAEVDVSTSSSNLIIDTTNELSSKLQNSVKAVGGELSVATNGAIGKKSIDTMISTVDKLIEGLDAEMKSAMEDGLKKAKTEDYAGLADALLASEQEYNFKGFDFKGIERKPIASKLPANPLGSGGGSGGGKAAKEKAEKEVADLVLELDPLKIYIDRLKEISHETDILKKERERLYGKKYIDNLNKELVLQKESLRVENQKLDRIKQLTNEKQYALASQGVGFSSTGLISNYNEILAARQAAANSLQGESKEAAKKEVEALKKAMDDYEKYALDRKRESEKAIQDAKKQMSTLAKEQIEYPIKLIIEAGEDDKNLIKTISDIQRYNKGKINFSVNADESAKQLLNSLNTFRAVAKETKDAQTYLNSILGHAELQGDVPAQLELIKKQQENMKKLAGDLIEFGNQFRDAFASGLGNAVEMLNKELEKYSNITLQYEYLLDITTKLNKQTTEVVIGTYDKLADIYGNNVKQFSNVAESIKKSRDMFKVGTDEWLIANEKYLEAQAQLIQQEKKLAELYSQRYDAVVSTGRKELEEAMFGGKSLEEANNQFEKMSKERAKYLDTERKVYELSKMQKNIEKDIDKYKNNPKAENALRKFMSDELKYLQSKKKITQGDLDLSQKQYEVLKARVALEEARDSKKHQMQLQRNTDGTYSYIYVQDTSEQEEAEQKYKDAIDELYRYAMTRSEELQKESIQIRSEALDEYDKIAQKLKAGIIDEKEAQELLNKAFDEMKIKLEENAKVQAEMQQQAATAKLLQILGVSESDLGTLKDVNSTLKSTFDILDNNGEADGMDKVFKNLGLDASKYVGSAGERLAKAFEDLGGDENALNKLMKEFDMIGNTTAATILGLINSTGDISSATERILEESLNGAGDSFDKFLEQISSGKIKSEDLFTETIQNGLDGVVNSWSDFKKVVMFDMKEISAAFDASKSGSAISKATKNMMDSYKLYSKTLEEYYNNLTKKEKELSASTIEYNKNLDNTIRELNKEIQLVAEVTKKYANLRVEVTKALDEIFKYLDALEKKESQLQGNNGVNRSANVTNGSSSMYKQSGDISGFNEGSRVKVVKPTSYASPFSNETIGVSPEYVNNTSKGLKIDGYANGRYKVKSGDGQLGWFDPSALQAFHSGGKVDVNKEGAALLKKNEIVFTEKQAAIIGDLKNLIDGMNISKPRALTNISNSQAVNNVTNISITPVFPNATNAEEITEALVSLPQAKAQFLANNKN